LLQNILGMKIHLILVGKTEKGFIEMGINEYEQKLKHYIPFQIHVLTPPANIRKLTPMIIKDKETELLLDMLKDFSNIILLDEKGEQFTSVGFSLFVQRKLNESVKELTFVVGGSFGFSEKIKQLRIEKKIALSQMTYSHQMVRVIFLEQVYRAFTILKNEPYHHI